MKPFEDYFRRSKNCDAAPLVIRALEMIGSDTGIRSAVDLGCGTGPDTEALIKNNWAVTAVDIDPDALKGLLKRVRKFTLTERAHLTIEQADFLQATWPEVNLVVAMNALPFCSRLKFPTLWRKIVDSINPGGRFVGTFFGERRTWPPDTFSVTREQLLQLFCQFRRLDLVAENDQDDQNDKGEPIHWHIYRVIATK